MEHKIFVKSVGIGYRSSEVMEKSTNALCNAVLTLVVARIVLF